MPVERESGNGVPSPPASRGGPALALAALAVSLLCPSGAGAIERVALAIARVEGGGWSAEDVTVVLDGASTEDRRGSLQIGRLMLPQPVGPIVDVALRCRRLAVSADGLRCEAGPLTAGDVLGRDLQGRAALSWAPGGALSANIVLPRALGGRLEADVSVARGAVALRAQGDGLDAAAMLALAGRLGMLRGWEAGGRVDLDLTSGPDGVLSVDLVARDAAFSDPAGARAGEALAGRVAATLIPRAGGWGFEGTVALTGGQLFVDPLFVDTAAGAVRAGAAGRWSVGDALLSVERLEFRQSGVLEGRASLQASLDPALAIAALDAEVDTLRFPAGYETYVQPWLYGTVLGDLQTAGEAAGRVSIEQGRLVTVRAALTGVGLEDRKGRFALAGVDGRLRWGREGPPGDSELAWESGSLYRIAVGAATLPLTVGPASVALRAPVRVPVFDGALGVDRWSLRRGAGGDWRWGFDAVLTPLSLEALSDALGWPPLAGKLSGVIPDLRYGDRRLSVGGVLLVRAFDGRMTVRDLELVQPLGLAPVLSADVLLEDLDLEALSRTFSFGRVEGRLEGRMTGLRMVGWRPVAFDARLATPPGDDSRHRISQRAVDTIARIGGGGVTGALSRTFLGVLEEFPYDRLGVSCRLERGVCHMDGIAPADGGYYLVEGRLLPPRIDVIGYNRRVDWPTLLARIRAAIRGEGAVVE